MRFKLNRYLLIFLVLIFAETNLLSELKDRVLVVRNINSPISISVSNYYMAQRNIDKVIDINCVDAALSSNNENIDYNNYLQKIENPIKEYLSNHSEIDYIVLTKGIPIRLINVPNGPWGGLYSADSYIAGIEYNKIHKTQIVLISDINYGAEYKGEALANRFWNSSERFSHSKFGGYLVTRLDGYTENDAKSLVDRAIKAEIALDSISTKNVILLDECPAYGNTSLTDVPYSVTKNQNDKDTLRITAESAYGSFNSDLQLAYNNLSNQGIPTTLENTELFTNALSNLMGYCSWGSNDAKFVLSTYNSLTFSFGAIGETAVSTSARTFLPTTGGQSLVADLINQGITGMKGYVNEPLLQAIASPSILFDRYTKGWTLAESFYAASNLIKWQDIVIGDPIATAYPLFINSVNDNLDELNLNDLNQILKNDDINSRISIYSISGKLLKEFSTIDFNDNEFFNEFNSGVYILIINNSSAKKAYKIIK